MFSEAIIEEFYVLEYITADIFYAAKNMVLYRTTFVSAIEGFLSGIIITISLRAHTLNDSKAAEQFRISVTGICATTVAMMQ